MVAGTMPLRERDLNIARAGKAPDIRKNPVMDLEDLTIF